MLPTSLPRISRSRIGGPTNFDLLSHYLERRKAYGVPAPEKFGEAWSEYRRWLVVPLIVWIRNSNRCQQPEVNLLGAQRSSTAVMDLGTLDLFR